MENRLYQGVASSISIECRIHVTMKGIQHKKPVVIMINIFWFIFFVTLRNLLVAPSLSQTF